MFGRILLLVATLGIFHAAFSTYEHLSYLKALERPEGSLPPDIVVETLLSLVLGIIGACLNAPPLKEITWSSEMRKHKIDDMDSRLGFASYVNRGKRIFSTSNVSSKLQ
ncbi:magnesium transporter [Crepidotus variabilis]|uniref:Magnesium transporter n=1 Tax=Crepidotus variabilis TaxID=179855 RepID=A0A9P6EKC4_9AGAR|nr:magnesium transporter [Crepidotus variabilis]